jgi:hypothetical protein
MRSRIGNAVRTNPTTSNESDRLGELSKVERASSPRVEESEQDR